MKKGRSLTALLLAVLLCFGSLPAAMAQEESVDSASLSASEPEESAPAPEEADTPEEEPESPEEEPEESAPAQEKAETPEEEPEYPEEASEESAAPLEAEELEELEPQDGENAAQDGGDASAAPVDPVDPTTDPNYFSPVVELLTGEENAFANYQALRQAIKRADGVHPLTIKVAQKGKYYLSYKENSSHHRGIRLRSLTTLDLNGATIIRAGTTANLVQVETLNEEQSVAGYTCAKDVAIVNGTLDGGEGEAAAVGVNVINIGHVDGLRLENLTITHGQGTHLVEINGCRNVTIKGCTFKGFEPWDDVNAENRPEAIQLDISYNDAQTAWNGVYCAKGTPGNDKTVCQDVTITDCSFQNYPSGVGNHHALYDGPRSTGIRIVNNSFTNNEDFAYRGYAVWCYGFENSEVSGNRFTGKYAMGVRVSAGQVQVKNNRFGTASKPFTGRPIYLDSANCNVVGQLTQRKRAYVTNTSIRGNTIYTSYSNKKEGGITALDKAAVTELSGNTITATKSCGIAVKGGSTVTKLSGNQVKKASRNAVYVAGSRVTNLTDNKLTATGSSSALQMTNKSTVTNVRKNTITAKSGQGIAVKGNSTVTKLSGNQVKKAGKNAIYISSSRVSAVENNTISASGGSGAICLLKSRATRVSKNKVRSARGAGVSIGQDSVVSTVSGNTIPSPKGDGIYLGKGKVTTVSGNRVTKGKKNGILVSASGVVTTVKGNTVTGCKEAGIRIANPNIQAKVQKNRVSGNKKNIDIAVKKEKPQETGQSKTTKKGKK